MEVSGQHFSWPLYLRQEPWYPLNRMLGGPRSRFGSQIISLDVVQERALDQAEIRNPNCPARNLITIPTTLTGSVLCKNILNFKFKSRNLSNCLHNLVSAAVP
jgi:hypothetical protein